MVEEVEEVEEEDARWGSATSVAPLDRNPSKVKPCEILAYFHYWRWY